MGFDRAVLAIAVLALWASPVGAGSDADDLADLDRELLRLERLDEDAWREGLERLLADPEEADRIFGLIRRCLGSKEPGLARRALLVAGGLGPEGAPLIPDILRTLVLEPPSFGFRPGSCSMPTVALGYIGRASIPALAEMLEHADLARRLAAVGALTTIARGSTTDCRCDYFWSPPRGKDWEPAMPALVAAAGDEDPGLRIWAVRAARNIGPPAVAAVPALIACLDDEEVDIRREAAIALGRVGDRRAIPPLRRIVSSEDDPARVEAARGLAFLDPDDPLPVEVLVETLERRPRPSETADRRCAAMDAISALGRRARAARSAVLRALRREPPAGHVAEIRHIAVRAVRHLGEPDDEVIRALIQALGDFEIGFLAQEELSEIGKPAVPALTRAMVRRWVGRDRATEALREIVRRTSRARRPPRPRAGSAARRS